MTYTAKAAEVKVPKENRYHQHKKEVGFKNGTPPPVPPPTLAELGIKIAKIHYLLGVLFWNPEWSNL